MAFDPPRDSAWSARIQYRIEPVESCNRPQDGSHPDQLPYDKDSDPEEVMTRLMILAIVPLALSGCVVGTIASTAVDVVTLPVKAASKGVDLATTSQSEADEKRGRAIRKQEECVGKAQRHAERRGEEPDTRHCYDD
ncbi:hypothetical protein [Sphingosinicella sp. LY1275]|uniref:hypothetical protein n=1 Tax=Sphingosinicella sp. LY1275 TaxID=3095379 RepID=UPI002ADEBDBC|nr:hypothetical protein [Sphingosinicella sp. LY1275]MEA1013997.1 hypothetical protein [Sphingosinicella sp. LY1275]